MTEERLTGEGASGIAGVSSTSGRLIGRIARFEPYDVAALVLIAALTVAVLCTFRDYAISNDEGVQHHYGELIIAYYASGFKDQGVFNFENLYLYGGLFDVLAILLGHLIPIDPLIFAISCAR
jgi:hypothetical protein